MIEIHFQHEKDAKRFFSFLQQLLDVESIKKYTLHYEDSHIIKCVYSDNSTQKPKDIMVKWMQESLCQFVLQVKINDWIQQILLTTYHYQDEVEQQQIMEIVHSLLNGKQEELATFLPKINFKKHFTTLIKQSFTDRTFSFDSFVTFRLRPFMEELKKYIEISLDEYKMEQEYQMFIQTLREFLENREPKIKHLHLIFAEDITFYDEQFIEIKRSEIAKMVDRRLLINHPVYIDSATIAPLLSIAPERIIAYSEDPEQLILKTIRNIFEERLIDRPLSSFVENKQKQLLSSDKKWKTLDF